MIKIRNQIVPAQVNQKGEKKEELIFHLKVSQTNHKSILHNLKKENP
jgi:hypothetical protein